MSMSKCCGSSPRVRGTGREIPANQRIGRFIPACAGNGLPVSRWRLGFAVHPRVCGERSLSRKTEQGRIGSSPRVRGTDGLEQLCVPLRRFIPACAGNGQPWVFAFNVSPVHPRVCGERMQTATKARERIGSSPRVRGTVGQRHPRDAQGRFIPACAGNGRIHHPGDQGHPVHPRVCGERRQFPPQVPEDAGSSPRVRGTVPSRYRDGQERRFIPACAGNGRPPFPWSTP